MDGEEIAEKSPEYAAALKARRMPFPVEQFPIPDYGVPEDISGLVDLARRVWKMQQAREFLDAHHYLKDVKAVGERLCADWECRYGHPVAIVETFVDPGRYNGTLYTASGWKELGKTDGFGRVQRDFYTAHGKPKRLFAKELCIRTLASAPIAPEQTGFPLAAQAARLLRIADGKKPESVELPTSLPPEKLNALDWLKLNRASWGIESGLHQRLDVRHLDDLSRVRKPRSMLFMGMFRRLSNSLCPHRIALQPRPHHKTTTEFFSAMNANHHSYPFRALFASRPSFSTAS